MTVQRLRDPEHVARRASAADVEAAPAAVARAYEPKLSRIAGAASYGPPPPLDPALLGLGADGHTASLFPHTKALAESRRWFVANEVPALAATRITATFPLLQRARAVFF